MCWERNARRPLARQNAPCSSAPVPSVGTRSGEPRSIDDGAKDRARRATDGRSSRGRSQTTGSSYRATIARSCTTNASAMPARRSSASSFPMQIGSSLRLPLVITSGTETARSRRWWSGVAGSIAPQRRWPGAMPGASRPRSATRTIGARHELSAAASSLVGSNHSLRRREVGHHHGERLVRPELPLPETPHRPLVGRIARQVEPTEPLDRHDRAVPEHRRDAVDDVAVDPPPLRIAELHPWTARSDTPRARRGTAGRPDPRTRAGTTRTSGRRASTCAPGRTGGTR